MRGQGRAGGTREAEAAIRRYLALNPSRYQSHLALAFNLQEQGRFSEAERSLMEAIHLEPNQGNAYYGLAQGRKFTAADMALVDQMVAVLANDKLNKEDLQHLCYALGKIHDDLGLYEKAIGYYDKANSLALAKLRSARGDFNKEKYRGQIDRTIELFSEDFFRRYGALGSNSSMPIFVLGMMRSGTTLVEQILSTHPDVGGGGELMFWMQNARKTLDAHDVPHIERLSQLTAGYLEILRAVAPDKAKVTDKMPANYLLLGAIHLAFPQARVIHCRRNPLDTCLSIYMQSYSVSPDFAHDRGNIVFVYQQYRRLMAHWRRTLPQDVLLEIDYEELVLNREEVTRRMIAFCGLDWTDDCLDHQKGTSPIRTSSIWQARQPIYNSSVERWRNYEQWLGDYRILVNE